MSIDKGQDAQGNHRDKKGFKEQKNREPPVQGKIILYTVIQKAAKYLNILLFTLQKQSLKLERQKINIDNILPFVKKAEFLPVLLIWIRSDPDLTKTQPDPTGSKLTKLVETQLC